MKHRRGIDLVAPIKPPRYEEHHASPNVYETLNGMREWEVLGAKCGKCGLQAWLDPRKVTGRFGNLYLSEVGCDALSRAAVDAPTDAPSGSPPGGH